MTLKGTIPDFFYNLLIALQIVFNTFAQVAKYVCWLVA